MDEIKLEQIKERCNRATDGPWISFVEDRDHTCGSNFIRTAGNDIELIGASVDDQDFIANARQDIPWLINEVYKIKKLLKDVEYGEQKLADAKKYIIGSITRNER